MNLRLGWFTPACLREVGFGLDLCAADCCRTRLRGLFWIARCLLTLDGIRFEEKSILLRGSVTCLCRQLHRHAGTLAGSAVGGDGSPVSFDQGFGDGQAQPEAARGAGS
jgi:hypothetical protein